MDRLSLSGENSLFPVPAALLTFRSGSGLPRFVSVNWLGMGCDHPVALSAAFRATDDSVRDLRSDGRFAVNLPPEELLQQQAFRCTLAEAAGDLRAADGFSLCNDALSVAPLIAECPIRIECQITGLYTLFDQEFIRGEVVAVHLQGSRFSRDEDIDFYRLGPLASPSRRSAIPHPGLLPG